MQIYFKTIAAIGYTCLKITKVGFCYISDYPPTLKVYKCCKINTKLIKCAYHIDNVDMIQPNPLFSSYLFLLNNSI